MLNHSLQLKDKNKKSALLIMFSWGKVKLSNGTSKYGRKRIGTGISLSPVNLKNGELYMLPTSQLTEYSKRIAKIIREGEEAFEALLDEYESSELILPSIFKEKIDELQGKNEKKYPYSFDIIQSIEEIIKEKKVAESRAIQLRSCGANLKVWADQEGVVLDWRRFSDQDYFNFMRSLKDAGRADSTVDQYRKRINSFIRELKAEKIPVKASPRNGRNLNVLPKQKVNLTEDHLMKIFNHDPAPSNYPRVNRKRYNIRKILMILLTTGCRIADIWEVCNHENFVTLEDGELYVDYVASKMLKGKKRNRVIAPIFPNIKEMILNNPPEKISDDKIRKGVREYMIEIFGEEEVIKTDEGEMNVALDFHPHACRSTLSTLFERNFISERLSDQLLAHTPNKGRVNDHYIQLTKEEQAQALRTILIKEKRMKFFSKEAEFNLKLVNLMK